MAVQSQAPATVKATRPYGVALMLTEIIILLGAVASAGGLFWTELYRDSAYMVAQAVGQDLVTLLIAVPALTVTVVFVRRGSARATLAWMGLLSYMTYTYTTYAFGSAFNKFFLIYVALFALCIAAMVAAFAGLDLRAWAGRFDAATPSRPLAVFMFLVGLMLCGLWLPDIFRFMATDTLPPTLVLAAIPTNFVYVMDLGIVTPLAFGTGVLLWRRRPWGHILAGIVLAKAVTMGLALLSMLFFMVRGGQALEIPPFVMSCVVTAGGMGLGIWFFRHCRQ